MVRINRAIELLEQDQADLLRRRPYRPCADATSRGSEDAHTWADYINVGMEHGAFDMAGLAAYMRGLVDGGPTRLRPPHADGDRRGAGERHRRGERPLQRLAVPPDPGPRRARHPALPGGDGRRRARLRRVVPLPAPAGGRRPVAAQPARAACAARRTRRGRRRDGGRPCSASARAGAARSRPPPPIWGLVAPGVHASAATPGRSTRAASCCWASSSRARRASPTASEILAVPGLGFAELGPGDLGLRSATDRCRATPTRPRCTRRASASSPPAGGTASPSWRARAGKHRRRDRRGRAGDRRPPRGHRRPGRAHSEAHDAGVDAYICRVTTKRAASRRMSAARRRGRARQRLRLPAWPAAPWPLPAQHRHQRRLAGILAHRLAHGGGIALAHRGGRRRSGRRAPGAAP